MSERSLIRAIERVPLDSLVLYPGNPRRGDVAAVAESLRENSQYEPLVVQASTRYVLAGNHRLLAAQELGWPEIDVVVVDVDDEHARRILLSSNRTADLGTYDEELLAAQLAALRDSYAGTGYSEADRAELEARLAALREPVEEVPAGEPPAVAVSQPGEAYELGPHRIVCGDCRDPAVLGLLLGEEQADLLWTDPPYGVSYAGKNEFLNQYDRGNRIQSEIVGDHLSPEETEALWRAAFAAVRPFLRPGAAYYVTGPGDSLLLLLLLLALRDSGYELRQILVWAKDQFVLGRRDYHGQHEPIVYGWMKGSHAFYGRGGESTLWHVPRPRASKLHPTTKPVELIARAIRNSTIRGGFVLDPFAGSGSTLIAYEQEGRVCRAVEVEPAYCDVIRQRYADHVGDPAYAPR